MANTLKFKRGLLAGLPTAAEGEPLFTTDTADLYIGTSTGNQRFQKYIASGTTSQYLRGDGSLATFPTNIVTGTGTTDYIPRWASGSTLGNSMVRHTNNIGIGLGVAPRAWLGAYYTLDFLYGSISNTGAGQVPMMISQNCFFDGTNWQPIYSGVSKRYEVSDQGFVFFGGASTTTGNPITFTQHMRLTQNGRLLLGTTSETTQRLIVSGDVKFDADAATNGFYWDNTNKRLGIGINTSISATLHLYKNEDGGLEMIRLQNASSGAAAKAGIEFLNDGGVASGFIGVHSSGTSTGIGFPNATILRSNLAAGVAIISSNASGIIRFFTGGTSSVSERARITETGLFGIGTLATTPSYRLDVVGSGIRTAPTPGSTGLWGSFVLGSSLDSTSQYFDAFRISGTGAGGYASNATNVVFQVWNGSAWSTQMAINQGTGAVGIGTTGLTNYALRVSKNIVGGATSYGVAMDSTIQSTVGTSATAFFSNVATQAASFTLTEINNFYAVQGTFGAGSTVTNQYGFRAHSGLTGATNNYGFFGEIPSGTGRWNLYMAGTGANYINGSLWIGTTGGSEKLHLVGGNARFDSSNVNVVARDTGTGYSVFVAIGQNASGAILDSGVHGSTANSLLTGAPANSGILATRGAHQLHFGTNGNSRMFIDANGNLLVGAATTTYKFDVQTSGLTIANLTSSNVAGGYVAVGRTASVSIFGSYASTSGGGTLINADALFFRNNSAGIAFSGTGATPKLWLTTSDNLVLNSTSDTGERLQVNGTMRVTGASNFGSDATINQITVGKGGGNVSTNTVVGLLALSANTTGSRNSAFGITAMTANTTGVFNSAFGYEALYTNISGNSNSAFGQGSLYSNTASENVAMGLNALYNNTSGGNNVAIGVNSGRGTNPNTTGSNNIFIGHQAYGVSSTESNRTWIGNTSTASTWLGGNLLVGTTTNVGSWINIGASTTAKAHLNLASGSAPTAPQNGDIWFDGTDIKMRIGGVTKTFTLT